MKLLNLIYSVREAVKEFTDDSELDDRYITHLLDIKRAKYIRQDLNNFAKPIDNNIIQSLCIPLVETSAFDCDIDIECNLLLRSKYKIPNTFITSTKNAILTVRSINKLEKPFLFIDELRLPFVNYAMFPNKIYTFLGSDNYIYVFSNDTSFKLLDCVLIKGVFESPVDLIGLETCCEDCTETNTCFTYESDYPLPSHLIDVVLQDVKNELLNIKKVPEDRTNDATDAI